MIQDKANLIDLGRLAVVQAFLQDRPGLNLGSGLIRFKNKLNVDNGDHPADADVLWDLTVFPYPFPAESQEEIVFTEVLEHLPDSAVIKVLEEISRILKPGGRLVLSVPNNNLVSKLLDPIFWMRKHKHYSERELRFLLSLTDLHVLGVFSSGTIPWGVVTLTYAVNWAFRRKKADLFQDLVTRSFSRALASKVGGTLFLIADKKVS